MAIRERKEYTLPNGDVLVEYWSRTYRVKGSNRHHHFRKGAERESAVNQCARCRYYLAKELRRKLPAWEGIEPVPENDTYGSVYWEEYRDDRWAWFCDGCEAGARGNREQRPGHGDWMLLVPNRCPSFAPIRHCHECDNFRCIGDGIWAKAECTVGHKHEYEKPCQTRFDNGCDDWKAEQASGVF